MRQIASKPSRLTAAVAATAAAGAIAAVAVTAPWAEAGAGPAAAHDSHSTTKASGFSDVVIKSPAQHAATKLAMSRPAAAKPAAAKHAAKPKPAGPTTFYDAVSPTSIPGGQAVAVYSNGAYQASNSAIAGRDHVMWIDVNGSNPSADVLDVEPGDATPAGAAAWVQAKLTKDPGSTAVVYTFKAAWGETQAGINALPSWMHPHVKYWIADPTGSRHILPGSEATQWYWGQDYDMSAANPGFFR